MHWLTKWFHKRSQASRPKRPVRKVHLEVEGLENRLVPTVTFGGGSVLPHVEVQALYIGSDWATDPNLRAQATQFDNFLQFLVDSPYMDMLSNHGYNVGRGTFTFGQIDPLDITTLPLVNGARQVTDAMIHAEVDRLIGNGTLAPQDMNRVYVVFVEPGVTVIDTVFGGSSTTSFSGYHHSFVSSDQFGNVLESSRLNYAVIPYHGSVGNQWNSSLTPFQSMTQITSHELAEGITDPAGLKPGWVDQDFANAHPKQGGEICDIVEGLPDRTVYLNGWAVEKVADQNDNPIAPVGATRDAAPAQPVAQANGFTFIIYGTDRELFYTANGINWAPIVNNNGVPVTGADAISAGADGVLDAVFNDGELWQLTNGFSVWTKELADGTPGNVADNVTEGPGGVVFATFGSNHELREFVGNAWHGVGTNGFVPVGKGQPNVMAISAGADGILDVLFSNGNFTNGLLWQYNISANQWKSQVPVPQNVSAVAEGPNGQLFVVVGTGSSSQLDRVTNVATGALQNLNAPGTAAITVGSDGVLDTVSLDDFFAGGALQQYFLNSQTLTPKKILSFGVGVG